MCQTVRVDIILVSIARYVFKLRSLMLYLKLNTYLRTYSMVKRMVNRTYVPTMVNLRIYYGNLRTTHNLVGYGSPRRPTSGIWKSGRSLPGCKVGLRCSSAYWCRELPIYVPTTLTFTSHKIISGVSWYNSQHSSCSASPGGGALENLL